MSVCIYCFLFESVKYIIIVCALFSDSGKKNGKYNFPLFICNKVLVDSCRKIMTDFFSLIMFLTLYM